LVLTKMKESYGPDIGLDFRGLALVTAGALGVVWGLMRGNEVGWTSVELVASLGVGVALLVAFIAWETRAPEPMLPVQFFRSRSFSAGNIATNPVSLLLSINVRKSQRIALRCGKPSLGPISTSLRMPRTWL